MKNTKEITNKLNKKTKMEQTLAAVHTSIFRSKKISAIFAPYCHIKKLTKLYESLTVFT